MEELLILMNTFATKIVEYMYNDGGIMLFICGCMITLIVLPILIGYDDDYMGDGEKGLREYKKKRRVVLAVFFGYNLIFLLHMIFHMFD